jgi:hypothetical protein
MSQQEVRLGQFVFANKSKAGDTRKVVFVILVDKTHPAFHASPKESYITEVDEKDGAVVVGVHVLCLVDCKVDSGVLPSVNTAAADAVRKFKPNVLVLGLSKNNQGGASSAAAFMPVFEACDPTKTTEIHFSVMSEADFDASLKTIEDSAVDKSIAFSVWFAKPQRSQPRIRTKMAGRFAIASWQNEDIDRSLTLSYVCATGVGKYACSSIKNPQGRFNMPEADIDHDLRVYATMYEARYGFEDLAPLSAASAASSSPSAASATPSPPAASTQSSAMPGSSASKGAAASYKRQPKQ